MRHGLLRHGFLTLAALAAWSLAAPGIGAARADDAQVTVVDAGGGQRTLSLTALGGGDVVEGSYTLRSPAGESVQTVTGFSPAAILDAAGADPYGFSYLEVRRPAGGSVLLSRHQALDPGAFPDGPPVLHATATGTAFLRPSAGPGDHNATDSFEAPQGLTVVLRSGSPLQVRAEASTLRTRPGRPVAFAAIVERSGAGEQLSYSWYFDDGDSSTGPRTRHRFAKRGSYDVVVGVTAPGDDAGASAVVTVQVGAPLAGPNRKGGGRSRDTGAPDHGSATGNGMTGGGAPTDPRSDLSPDSGNKYDRVRGRGRRAALEPEGERVSGMLLTSARTSPPEPPSPAAARTGKLDGEDGGPALSDAALGVLATLGLLGLGALAELRGGFVSLSGRKAPRGALR